MHVHICKHSYCPQMLSVPKSGQSDVLSCSSTKMQSLYMYIFLEISNAAYVFGDQWLQQQRDPSIILASTLMSVTPLSSS